MIGTMTETTRFQVGQTLKVAAPRRSAHKAKLPSNFVPGRYSVICGRGKKFSKSPGNRHLRSVVNRYLTPYSMAKSREDKTVIISAIIGCIREAATVGAFIKQEDNGEWWEVDDAFAREKIGCIFRDILHTQYRSSTKAKQARKKAEEGSSDGAKPIESLSWESYYTTVLRAQSSSRNQAPADRPTTSPVKQQASDSGVSPPPLCHPSLILPALPSLPTSEGITGQSHQEALCNSGKLTNDAATRRCRLDAVNTVSPLVPNNTEKSTCSLLKEALGVMTKYELTGGSNDDDDDFPDDISDIFDENSW